MRAPVVPFVEPRCNQQPQLLSLCSESNLAEQIIGGSVGVSFSIRPVHRGASSVFQAPDPLFLCQQIATRNVAMLHEL